MKMKMMNVNGAKTAIVKTVSRTGLILRKHSPEILMGLGVAGVITSTVMACKATLKADGLMTKAKEDICTIKEVQATAGDLYDDKDYRKDMSIVYVQTTGKFLKLYGPAISVGMISIGCLLGSHNIMQKRNLGLLAAYKLAEQSFNDYRKRVVEEYGEVKDHQFKYGIRQEQITEIETDADGKKKKVKKTINVADPNLKSQYARFFDEACVSWSKTPEYNLIFLKCQQNYANDLLHARGHLFLNEVYNMLGIPHSQAGAVVGWVLGDGDNFVDFGIYDLESMPARDFVNGYERSILLDFNVDGVIYDLI